MKTICMDGPLRGQFKASDSLSFKVYVNPPGGDIGATELPTPVDVQTVTYQLKQLPYDKLPLTDTGGPDYEKLSIADAEFVAELYNRADIGNDIFSIRRNAFQYWSCK